MEKAKKGLPGVRHLNVEVADTSSPFFIRF